MSQITEFNGKHAFLSNFYPSAIEFEGITYPTVEHAFQAAKTNDRSLRKGISQLPTPGQAKRAGRKIPNFNLQEWEIKKYEVMLHLIKAKFNSHPHLKNQLLQTGENELIEGNWWNDTYWGVCRGVGKNILGKILMKVRDELK